MKTEEQQTLREFVENFKNGLFDHNDIDTQIDAGWVDWFCKDSSLKNKTKVLGKKVCQLAELPLLRDKLDNVYIFFKNNCRLSGGLYDSFSICDIETDDVLFWIGHEPEYDERGKVKRIWTLYHHFDKLEEPVTKGWKNIKNYFKGGKK